MFNFVEELPSIRPNYVLKLGTIATVLVVLAIAGYVLVNPAPPEPKGEVLDVKLYVPPSQAAEVDGAETPVSEPQPDKTLLVLSPVKIHNTSEKPFSIFDLSGIVRLGNAEFDSADVSMEDFRKVFQYYPDLIAYEQQPLLRHSVIQPGETVQGLLIFNYPLSQDQWDMRTSFQVTASFDHGKDIVLTGADTPETWPLLNAETR